MTLGTLRIGVPSSQSVEGPWDCRGRFRANSLLPRALSTAVSRAAFHPAPNPISSANPLGPDGISGTDDDDLRLTPGSPCIDAGNSDALAGSVPLDLSGGPRFVDDPSTPNTGVGGTRVVDHGAFEFQ